MPASPSPTHPDLDREQAYLDRAYDLPAMRERAKRAADIADSASSAVDSAIAQAHLRHQYRSLDTDVGGLAFGRLDDEDGDTWYVGRRHVEDDRNNPVVVDWRAPSRPLLPGHARRPDGPAAAPALRDRAPARRPVRRGLRRPRQRRRRPPRRHPDRCSRSSSGHGPARCATSWPRSPPSRTSSSGRHWTRAWSCRAAPARARRRWACTGPPSSSTSTAPARPRGRAGGGPTRCSCATSPRCCRRSARPPPARRPSSAWSAGRWAGCGRSTTRRWPA